MVETRQGELPRPTLFPITFKTLDKVMSSGLDAFVGDNIQEFLKPGKDIFGDRVNYLLTEYIEKRVIMQIAAAIQSGHTAIGPIVGANYMMGAYLGAQILLEASRATGAKLPTVRSGDINAYLREQPQTPDFNRMKVPPSEEVLRNMLDRKSKYLFDADPALTRVKEFFTSTFPQDKESGYPYLTYYPFEEGLRDVYFPVKKAFDRIDRKH